MNIDMSAALLTGKHIAGMVASFFNLDESGIVESGLLEALPGVSSEAIERFLHHLETTHSGPFRYENISPARWSPSLVAHKINMAAGLDRTTIRSLLREVCREGPDKDAVTFDGNTWTYEQILDTVCAIAGGMAHFGIGKGTKVVLVLSNRMEYIFAYFALFTLGAIPIPVSVRWEKSELFNVLEDSGATVVICEDKIGGIAFGSYVAQYLSDHERMSRVFFLGENRYGPRGVPFQTLGTYCPTDIPREHIAPGDPATILYTSGTTGTPKGVMLRQNDLAVLSQYTAAIWQGRPETPMLISPLYSMQGFLSLLTSFVSGCCCTLISSANPDEVLREIAKGQNSIVHTQPTMWNLLLNCRDIDSVDFSGLRHLVVSGALCCRELAGQIEKKLGCRILNAYGLAEATGIVTMTRPDDPEEIRLGTVGRPLPGVELKIVDAARRPVARGEVGELAVRGYNMIGYYKKPEKTAAVIDADGWLYTGDLARYHDRENICIVGRCKDMIIRGGINVYAVDIEDFLLTLPQVRAAAIVGRKHVVLGEEIVAFIVVHPGEMLTKEEISSYSFHKISNYKIPDKIHFVSELPLAPSGKVDKKALAGWAENGVPSSHQIVFF